MPDTLDPAAAAAKLRAPLDPAAAAARLSGPMDPAAAAARLQSAAPPAPDESVRDSLLGLDPASRSARFTANRAALDAKEKGVARMGVEALGGTLEQAAKDTYHGVVDPLKEGMTQLQKDDAAREHPPLGDAPAGPNVGAPQRTVGDSALTAAKMVGKSAMGLGAAVTGISPALSVAGQADAAAGTNVLPAWKRMTTEAAEKIVPKSAPGSIVDNLVPDSVRSAAVDATQFGLENAPLAGALKLAHGGGVPEEASAPAADVARMAGDEPPSDVPPPAAVVPPEDFGKLAEVAPDPSNEVAKQEIQPPETAPAKSSPQPFAETPEAINAKTWYHGTGTKGLTAEALDSARSDPASLFGSGVYLTDDPTVAEGYAKARGGRAKTPTVYEAKVDVRNPLRAEAEAPADVRDAVSRSAEGMPDNRANVDAALAKPNATAEELIQAYRSDMEEFSHDTGTSKAEMADFTDSLVQNLREKGYDAITHEGGKRVGAKTGGPRHQVLIPLDPSDTTGTGGGRTITSFAERALTRADAPPRTQAEFTSRVKTFGDTAVRDARRNAGMSDEQIAEMEARDNAPPKRGPLARVADAQERAPASAPAFKPTQEDVDSALSDAFDYFGQAFPPDAHPRWVRDLYPYMRAPIDAADVPRAAAEAVKSWAKEKGVDLSRPYEAPPSSPRELEAMRVATAAQKLANQKQFAREYGTDAIDVKPDAVRASPEALPAPPPKAAQQGKPYRPRGSMNGGWMGGEMGAVRVPTGAEIKQFVAGPKSVTTQIGDVIDDAVAPYVEKGKEALAGTKVGRALEAARSAIKDQPADLVGPGYVAAKENAAGEGRWQANQAAPHVEALTKAMKDATPEQQAAVTDWARKSKTTPDSPFPAGFTPEQEATTRAALDHFNVMRQKMVDVGALSPHALGEYDRFMPTRYEEFENQPYRPGGGSPKVNPLNAAHDGWGARVMLPEADAAKAVGEAEPDYLHAVKDAKGNPETLVKFSTPEGYAEWKDNLKTVFGKDAGKLLREEFTKFDPKANGLTRITDPARLFKMGVDEANARIAKHTFLNGLAEMTDEKGPYVKDARSLQRPENQAVGAEPGYTKLEGRGWGKLDGKLVRNDARADLVQSFGDKAELSQKQRMLQGMYDFAKGGMNAFKTARVVFHPAMVARHVAAAASELTYMGYDPFNPENAPRIASAAKDVAPGGKYYENVVRRGYEEAGGAVSREEILKSDAMKSPAERAGEAIFSGGVSEGRSPLTNSTFATAENAAVVKGAYLRAKQGMGRAVFDPLVRAQKIGYALLRNEGLSDAAAAAEVEKFTMDPQKFSGGTKVLSDVLAPWLRYHLEAARVATNAAVEHPTRFAIDRLRTRIVQATIAAATGLALSDKEKQAIDDEHPGAVAIGRDKDGKPMLLDARYLDMLGGSPIYTGRTKVGEGMDTAAGIRKYLLDKTSIGENPVADVISAVTTGKDRNGRDTSGFQSWLRNFTPGLTPAVGWDARKIAAAAKGEQASQTTQKQTVLQSALDALGIKENSLDPKFEKDRIDNEEGQIVNRRNVRAAALKGETLDTESPDKEASAREEPLTIADIDAQLAAAQKRLDAAPGHVAPAITAHMDNLKKARLQLTGPKPYRPKNVPEPAGK